MVAYEIGRCVLSLICLAFSMWFTSFVCNKIEKADKRLPYMIEMTIAWLAFFSSLGLSIYIASFALK